MLTELVPNLAAASISGPGLFSAFIMIIVAALLFWLAIWFMDWVGVPEPFNKVAKVLVGLFAFVICANALLTMAGHPLFTW